MNTPASPAEPIGQNDLESALFAQLVMQQANMASLLMGLVPNPETGETIRDLEAAEMFINTLGMLENKTRGNLSKEEKAVLQQSLMRLRLAFVEAANAPHETGQSQAAQAPQAQPGDSPKTAAPQPGPQDATADAEEESRKKFSKKY